jgi:Poly(R)-hydroxyalkanoic acid synthase subunit (PHA_synth_III_E)
MIQDEPNPSPEFVQRTLNGVASAYAGVFALFGAELQGDRPDLATLFEPMVEHYRRFFVPPSLPPAAGQALEGAAVLARWQGAADRAARIAGTIALDASARLTAALQESGPGTPPITSLRALYELWIECGEAAYGAAAQRKEFAAAQAELLAATTELQAAASRP